MLTAQSHVPQLTLADFDVSTNCRRSERSPASGDQAWIGWWEGRLYRKSPAALVDIGQGGVRLVAEAVPPVRSTIWVCLSGLHKTEWVDGIVLGSRVLETGSSEVRMAFSEACPYAFFEIAVYGFPAMTDAACPA